MANIKFFKKATRPTSAGVGSVWFDSTRKAIVLTGATAAEDVIYSGCITNAVVDGEKLLLTKTDGDVITVDFAVFATDAALNSGLSTKVDKVAGKGLSTNDFTTDEKNKLAGIAAGANAYSLPIASATVLGGIKVGNNLTISNGVLSGTADTHYTNTFTIKGAGTAAATFNQSSDATLNIAAGTGISVSATSGTITIANTVANTHLKNFLDIQAAGTSVVKYTQDSDKTLKFVAGSNVTLTPNAANGTITISSTDTNTDTKVTSVGNHYPPSGGTAKTNGNVLTSVTCDAAGHVTAVGGRNDIPASWLTGTIDIARLPAGALERLFVVADEAAAMKANVQEGDTVKVTGNNNKMYFCVKSPSAGDAFATCFTEYTAGSATSVPWSGVTGKPSTFTPSAHTHTKSQITDFPTSMPASDVYAWAKAKTKPSYTKAEVGLGNVDNTADSEKTVKAAGTATTASMATSVIDYADANSGTIKIGYTSSGISGENILQVAGYTRIDGQPCIKDISKEALQAWLNLGSLAYSSATIPTVNNASLTIKQNGAQKAVFTANAASGVECLLTDTTYSAGSGLALSGTTFNLVWEEYE